MTRDGTWASKTGLPLTAHVPRKGGVVRSGDSVAGMGESWRGDDSPAEEGYRGKKKWSWQSQEEEDGRGRERGQHQTRSDGREAKGKSLLRWESRIPKQDEALGDERQRQRQRRDETDVDGEASDEQTKQEKTESRWNPPDLGWNINTTLASAIRVARWQSLPLCGRAKPL